MKANPRITRGFFTLLAYHEHLRHSPLRPRSSARFDTFGTTAAPARNPVRPRSLAAESAMHAVNSAPRKVTE
jgi:hypothetical protein